MKKLFIILLCVSCLLHAACSNSNNNKITRPVAVASEEDIVNHLRAKGCSDQEISLMLEINREVYSGQPGVVVLYNGHAFYVSSDGTVYDNGQTLGNCGIYTTKRYVHHLGQVGRINKDAWFQFSDMELRHLCNHLILHDLLFSNEIVNMQYKCFGLGISPSDEESERYIDLLSKDDPAALFNRGYAQEVSLKERGGYDLFLFANCKRNIYKETRHSIVICRHVKSTQFDYLIKAPV